MNNMKTKNIAMIVWEAIDHEMKRTGGKATGSDTTYHGEGAFLYQFDNDEIEGEIVLSIVPKGEK